MLYLLAGAYSASVSAWLGGQAKHATCTCTVKVVFYAVILNFTDQATEDIYNGFDTKQARRIPSIIWRVAVRKLDMLNAAHELKDLRIPPANRLKVLKGKQSGMHSIRINDQFRIIFKWVDGQVKDVAIMDYH